MLHVALYQPEIPPNTGNIIRLCANAGAQLHLIYPLGFAFDDKKIKRAGLDYHEFADICHYDNYQDFIVTHKNKKIYACTTKASRLYTEMNCEDEAIFLFGPETRGLPQEVIDSLISIKIPMQENSRSLNLSNSVAIILYEGWRQLDFANVCP